MRYRISIRPQRNNVRLGASTYQIQSSIKMNGDDSFPQFDNELHSNDNGDVQRVARLTRELTYTAYGTRSLDICNEQMNYSMLEHTCSDHDDWQ